MHRRALLTGVSALAAARALAQPVSGPVGYRKLPPGPTNAANAGGGSGGGSATAPSLDLSFLTPGALDPLLTFTRASSGTYFDSGGVMRTAGLNLVIPSVPASGSWSLSSTTLVTDGTIAPDGTATAVKLNNTTANAFHGTGKVTNGIVTNQVYTASVYAKAAEIRYLQIISDNGSSAGYWVTFDLQTGTVVFAQGGGSFAGNTNAITPAGNGWYRCSVSVNANTASGTAGRFYINNCNTANAGFYAPTYAGTGTDGTYIWGAQFEIGPVATQYAPTTTVANSGPRWDYDPVSLQLRGLLLEDQRTNGLRNSSNMSAVVPGTPGTPPAFWTFSPGSTGLSIDTVGSGVENGIAYVDVRYYGTTSASSFIITVADTPGANPAANGQSWTGSMYWRLAAGTLNGVTTSQIAIREATSASGLVKDNVFTVSNPNSGALRGQRVVASSALSGGGTVAQVQMRYYILINSGAVVDMTIRYGAPQTEQGDFATSFISTTGAAVTRSIDSCLIPPVNMSPWFASPGGSWFAEFDYFDSTPANGNRVIAQPNVSNGAATVLIGSTNLVGQYDGSAGLNGTLAATANTITKSATTWATGQAKSCTNGGGIGTLATLTNGYPQFATTGISFLSNGPALSAFTTSGHIRRVQYYPRVLADTEMQSLTTITDPSLFLNFMNPNTLDPRIAFTRASTATYTDVNGVVQTANNDTPRWDYDPVTHVLRGLLLEEARTNLIPISIDFTAWTGQSTGGPPFPVVTADQVVAPDGTMTADKIDQPVINIPTTSVSQIVRGITATAAVYTYTVWLRGAVGGEQTYLFHRNVGYPAVPLRVTLTTQWQRFVIVTGTLVAGAWNFYIGTDLRDTQQSATPAQTIYAWGAQVELGAFPTSFILTTGSTVTRAADSCVIPSANMTPWYSSTAGSWQAEFVDSVVMPPNRSARIIGANSAAGITPLWINTNSFPCSFDGATLLGASTITVGATMKAASRWTANTGGICLNGGTILNGAQPTGFAALATSGIGILAGNPGVLNETMTGYVRAVRYWPRVLSDAEMQQVTT